MKVIERKIFSIQNTEHGYGLRSKWATQINETHMLTVSEYLKGLHGDDGIMGGHFFTINYQFLGAVFYCLFVRAFQSIKVTIISCLNLKGRMFLHRVSAWPSRFSSCFYNSISLERFTPEKKIYYYV